MHGKVRLELYTHLLSLNKKHASFLVFAIRSIQTFGINRKKNV
jgi:hypothetical protein